MDATNSNLPPLTIDFDEKSNNDISHKPPVKSYATRVFQESTVGIVSSIFTTHSKWRRFFKVFLSSLWIAGFMYHCVAFLNHVFGYPEVVNISLDRTESYNWPAYTYCINNPVRRSVFCSTYPKYCMKPSEEFCKKYSSYCAANNTPIPKEVYYTLVPRHVDAGWILKFGSVPNALKINSSFIKTSPHEYRHIADDEISGPYLRSSGYRHTIKACYSLHSYVESNQQPLQKRRSKSPFIAEFIRFHITNANEMMNPRAEPGVYFSLHSPFDAENPLTKGLLLKGGRTYHLHVVLQEEISLKTPFKSNCMDYEERWEENNRTGPRSKMMCEEKCYMDGYISTYECVPYDSYYPHKERICGDNFTTIKFLEGDIWNSYINCLKSCRDQCRARYGYALMDMAAIKSSKYTTEISVQDELQLPYVKFEEQYQYIDVYIRLSNDEVKVLRHSPKYETVDVISSIGGFMGCWLGVALLDILDVFGSIFTVCRYAFIKRLNKDNKKASIYAM